MDESVRGRDCEGNDRKRTVECGEGATHGAEEEGWARAKNPQRALDARNANVRVERGVAQA